MIDKDQAVTAAVLRQTQAAMETGANMHVRGPGTAYTPEDVKAEHSPLPWRFLAGGDNAPRRWIDSADNFTVGRVFRADSAVGEANGAFIVRAVNSHEALVKALEGLVEWVWEDNRGDELAPLDEARAALQKAREESK